MAAVCYSYEELLYNIAVAKQELREQRKMIAKAYIKGDTFLFDIEQKTFNVLLRRVRRLEEQKADAIPQRNIA